MVILARGLVVALTFVGACVVYLMRRLWRPSLSAHAVERLRGDVLADALQKLGATYVKFGQILGSRPDILAPGYIEALARLQDAVAPSSFAAIEQVLAEELGADWRQVVEVDEAPIAAASVAHVHHARLADGREVALKIQRPSARSQIERDLALLRFGARLLDRIPTVHLLSLPGAVESFGTSLRGQLDFRSEAEHNRRIGKNFESWPDVRVPELVESLCTERVLAMEFVSGVKASQPEAVGGDRVRLARLGAESVLKMIFQDGFVHADLHPGNVLLTDDNKVVIIDMGMVATIPDDMIRPWVQTNLALTQQNGKEAARLFYSYAPSVGTKSYADYERDVEQFFQDFDVKNLSEIEVSEAVGGLMNILRRHRVKIDPVFTVVNVAMLVAEGLGKQLDPDIDMIAVAQPYLLEALQTAPTARAPARTPPSSGPGFAAQVA